MEEAPLTIASFSDAVAEAFALHDRFGRAHAVAVLDADGDVLDLTAFTKAPVDAAITWARCIVGGDDRPSRLLVLSAVDRDPRKIRDEDARKLRLWRSLFRRYEVEVVDWILTDGQWLRSLAMTAGLATWDGIDEEELLAARN